MKSLSILTAACLAASAADVALTWDPSPSPGVTNYIIYAATNAFIFTNRTVAIGTNMVTLNDVLSGYVAKVSVGNKTAVVLEDIRPGRWWLCATAVASAVESGPSDILQLEVAEPPRNLRTLEIQVSASLTNWSTLGYFKLRID
jgi:hypothetical protein